MFPKQYPQLLHYKADRDYGIKVAEAVDVDLTEVQQLAAEL